MHNPLAMAALGYIRTNNSKKTLSLWSLGYLSVGQVVIIVDKADRRTEKYLVFPVYVVSDSPRQLE